MTAPARDGHESAGSGRKDEAPGTNKRIAKKERKKERKEERKMLLLKSVLDNKGPHTSTTEQRGKFVPKPDSMRCSKY